MKLEAIILAAGPGSRMVELTRSRPKCLLPVGNQSLIWFAITGLKQIGISRIIILVPDVYESDIKQYCNKKFNSFKDLILEFVTVSTKADCGTAESILSLRDKIRGDFVVHSCDTIIDPKALSFLVNHYRLYDPILSMILSDNAKYFHPRPVPGRMEKERYMRDVIAVEPLDKLDLTSSDGYSANKVVFMHSERDLKQKLKIRSRQLALHPSLEVYSRFLDAHVYVCKQEMLEFMTVNNDMAVLKGEMIPLLISRQFSQLNQSRGHDTMEEDDVEEIRSTKIQSDYEIELKEKLENFQPRKANQSNCFQKASIPKPTACHAIIVKNLISYRANTMGCYLDCNRDAKSILSHFGLKNLNTLKECVLGENTIVGEKCLIKKGSIGSNCKIGDKVKLIDCVIMDNVEIESNTSLNECIVGSNSKIGPKCDLKSCIIGYKQVVPGGKKSNGDVMIDDDYAIDLSDPMVVENE